MNDLARAYYESAKDRNQGQEPDDLHLAYERELGRLRIAENIVEVLGRSAPPLDGECGSCTLCFEEHWPMSDPNHHEAACPWRRAKEWVSANRFYNPPEG